MTISKKHRICNPAEANARKWSSRFCSIKVMYAPESTCEAPATAHEFIDVVTKMLPPSKRGKVKGMLMDALRTINPEAFKDMQSIEDIKRRFKHRFGRDIHEKTT